MISFLPTQCMIFSTRFVVQSVKDFHHAILSGKLLHPRKAKRYSFHPYRLMFIFSQRRQHGYLYPNLCIESLRQCGHMGDNSHHAIMTGKLLHPRKAKRQRFHPYRLMFIFCQRRQHGCHMAFSLPESVHQIALPVQIHGR